MTTANGTASQGHRQRADHDPGRGGRTAVRRDLADRRIILMLGTPRSGSTWLSQILNSYKGVVYSNEPLTRLEDSSVRSIVETIKSTGTISREDRSRLIWECSRAYHDIRRPPFFAKRFQSLPAPLMLLAWAASHKSPWERNVFRALFSPRKNSDFEVLIKEVGWALHAKALVSALGPELILIYRHPCAVVSSQLRGRQLGHLADDQSDWAELYEPHYEPLGFDRQGVLKMDTCEYYALQWLVSNRLFMEVAESYPRTFTVIHERLCRDPEGGAKSVFDFLGWPMSEQTTRFIRMSTRSGASSLASRFQVHQPYYQIVRDPIKSAEAWRSVVTEPQKERILAIIKPCFPFGEFWGEGGEATTSQQASHVS